LSFSVCLLCASFDIGGAETHVLTLARALESLGHRVTVVSGGGVYEKEADTFEHIRLPLHKKRYFFFTLRALRSLFKRRRFDIIHAHARYPAFLCRLLGVRFVSTAHWVFSTRFPLGMLSFWGEECLAVSPDIGAYLKREYGLSEKRISLTVNGIDTARFRPRERKGELCICHCSRLDSDRAEAAFSLIEAVGRLYKDYPFHVRIVGDGTEKERLRHLAEATNREAGRCVIEMCGATAEVAAYVGEADIFVGVSRAALEAMAAECAVILAGNEGYGSIFCPHTAEEAEKSNFCCRGAEGTDSERLEKDLRVLLSLPRESLRAQGKVNRAYVEAHYSAHRLAQDALAVYGRVKKRRAVLCGYYGAGNVGDELLHRALTARLKREGYRDVLTLSRRALTPSSLYAVWRGYDFFLGGGNLLQNETSDRSLWFYAFFARLAYWRGASVSMLSGGLGGFRGGGERRAARVLALCDRVECRTEGDLAYALAMGAKDAVLKHDAVLSLPLGMRREDAENILLAFKTPKSKDEALAIRAFILKLAKRCGKGRLCLFAMHPADAPFVRRTARALGIRAAGGDADVFLEKLGSACAVYGNRLHAGVCGLRMGVRAHLWQGDEKSRLLEADVRKAAEALSLPSPLSLFSYTDMPREEPLSRLSCLRIACFLAAKKRG